MLTLSDMGPIYNSVHLYFVSVAIYSETHGFGICIVLLIFFMLGGGKAPKDEQKQKNNANAKAMVLHKLQMKRIANYMNYKWEAQPTLNVFKLRISLVQDQKR